MNGGAIRTNPNAVCAKQRMAALDFESIQEIAKDGFSGFLTVSALQASACCEIPTEPGVYLVLLPDAVPPVFLDQSVGGRFKGRDPTVSIAELQRAWIPEATVLYIGKAAGSLRSRVLQYMRFGEGSPVGHWGGRYIWQLQEVGSLIFCWKLTQQENPSVVEGWLIKEFKRKYDGRIPFANRQQPKLSSIWWRLCEACRS